MENAIHLGDAAVDLAVVERHLLDLDPAALFDHDAAARTLRCSTSAMALELQAALAQAGLRLAPDAIERLPSVCCGGCSG